AILLEGDPGSGKTFLSEIFHEFLGNNTEYLYTQCVEETNSDKLINTYNVPAIVKGDGDLAVAEGILTKAINDANVGKNVVLTIDELDKARPALDSYFLTFLQNGQIETMDNKVLKLTPDGRKRIFAIFAKNDERECSEAFKRRAKLVKLPPMPPVLAYKTLLRNFEGIDHDSKFLKFICKVYEAIYNEQKEGNGRFLRRLPALQELTSAITGDYVLYESGVNSSRRISSMIRELGKDDEVREKVTSLLVKKFKYQQMESNYNDETLDLDMSDPDNYMTKRDPNSMIDQYVQKKDSGEMVFEEDELEDPMREIAGILDNMKDDSALVFIDRDNKEKIVELGTISHKDPRAIDQLFGKIRFKGNPNSRFGFLDYDGDNFIAVVRHKGTLILVSNREYVSPYLLMRGLSTIIT
ncbi:MAG: AAA family ATPase, partial [Bacilli bacterium]|nr:AAA family ATPase [Bacilli bacterium]